MKRKDFLEKLEIVSGAIADKDITPVFTHVWFTGDTIQTYDSQIGISINHKTPFKGGVPKSFIQLVKVTEASEIEIEKSDRTLDIKFGSIAKDKSIKWRKNPDKLAMLIQDAAFEMPEFDEKNELPVSDMKAFLNSIKCCLRSVNPNISAPELLGITLIAEGQRLKMYSTDNKSISIEGAAMKKKPPFSRVILSQPFCKQLVALASNAKEVRITITDEHALAKIGGVITLFGNLIGEKDDPFDFNKVINECVPAEYTKHVGIPKRLRQAIDRAVVITGEKAAEAETTATVKDNLLILESKSEALGKVTDRISLGGDHPNVKITIQCKSLSNDLDTFERMFITERCWIMMNATSMYLVAGV